MRTPSRPFQQRHGQDALRLEVVLAHEGAPDQQVEGLVGAAHFDVGLERHGVIPLHEGIEELVQGDGRVFTVTLGEVVALHHAGQRVARAQADEVGGGEVVEPAELNSTTVFSGSRILKTCSL